MTRNGCFVFDRSVFSYIPAIGKVGIFVSHHDENSFPPNAPHIRHEERGEVTAVCLTLLTYRAVRLLPALPIRRGGSDLRIFRVGMISQLPCPIAVLLYKYTE